MVKLIWITAFSKKKNPDRTLVKNLGKGLVEPKPILFASGEPIITGTNQGCNGVTGTFESLKLGSSV
jgi:hypothetical protein